MNILGGLWRKFEGLIIKTCLIQTTVSDQLLMLIFESSILYRIMYELYGFVCEIAAEEIIPLLLQIVRSLNLGVVQIVREKAVMLLSYMMILYRLPVNINLLYVLECLSYTCP